MARTSKWISCSGAEVFYKTYYCQSLINVGEYVHIGCNNSVIIGEIILIGSKIYIIDNNHDVYCGENSASLFIPPVKEN